MKIFTFLMLLTSLIVSGCGSEPPKEKEEPKIEETIIKANFLISADVNPDVNGRPSPVVVRLYELKSIGKFEEADFFKLLEDYEAVLGTDLSASEKFHFKPGEIKDLEHPVSPETKFIAVTAAFRDFSHAVWRFSVPIEKAKTTKLVINLNNLNISIEKKQPK